MHDPLKAGDGLSIVDIRHWPGCGFELSGSVDLGPHKGGSYFLTNFNVRLRPESAEDDYDMYIAILQANRARVLARLKEVQATAPGASNIPRRLDHAAKTAAQDKDDDARKAAQGLKPAPKPMPKPPPKPAAPAQPASAASLLSSLKPKPKPPGGSIRDRF